MPVLKGGKVLAEGDAIPNLTMPAGTADNTIAAVRSDTLANCAADAQANFIDLATKVNALLQLARDRGEINP